MFFDRHECNHLRSSARKVRGTFHGTTSTGGEIVLTTVEGATITLTATDRLFITSAYIVASVGGDTAIYLDNDGGEDLDATEAVLRGTTANNQPLSMQFNDPVVGKKGGKPYCVCASGTVDAIITGYVVAAS